MTTIDVTDLSAPQVTSELYLPGTYQSSRRIDQRVRLVLSDTFPFPDGVVFWPDLKPGATDDERNKAFDALEAKNEALIRARSLDDWLRKGSVKRPGQPTTEMGYQLHRLRPQHRPQPPRPAHRGHRRPRHRHAGGPHLGAGRPRLALRLPRHPLRGQRPLVVVAERRARATPPTSMPSTSPNPDRAGYLGSGVVDGSVRDQYAMDEFQNALRVATTLNTRVDDGTPWGTLQHLQPHLGARPCSGGSLGLAGKTEDFGQDERAFGTRFLGSRGFVITAKQVDPLFTFDLSDPTHPRKVGGAGDARLHRLPAPHRPHPPPRHRPRAAAPGGGPMQLKIALLDVTDLRQPQNIATQLVGQGWSWSDALWDPKAFTWLSANKTLAIPFADFASNDFVSDLRLFHVDPATGIQPLGSLSMADVYLTQSGPNWSWSWSPWIRRAILADDVRVRPQRRGRALGPGGRLASVAEDGAIPPARLSLMPRSALHPALAALALLARLRCPDRRRLPRRAAGDAARAGGELRRTASARGGDALAARAAAGGERPGAGHPRPGAERFPGDVHPPPLPSASRRGHPHARPRRGGLGPGQRRGGPLRRRSGARAPRSPPPPTPATPSMPPTGSFTSRPTSPPTRSPPGGWGARSPPATTWSGCSRSPSAPPRPSWTPAWRSWCSAE